MWCRRPAFCLFGTKKQPFSFLSQRSRFRTIHATTPFDGYVGYCEAGLARRGDLDGASAIRACHKCVYRRGCFRHGLRPGVDTRRCASPHRLSIHTRRPLERGHGTASISAPLLSHWPRLRKSVATGNQRRFYIGWSLATQLRLATRAEDQ